MSVTHAGFLRSSTWLALSCDNIWCGAVSLTNMWWGSMDSMELISLQVGWVEMHELHVIMRMYV